MLDEQWPASYLQVYCDAVVDRDPRLVVDVMMAAGERVSGEPIGEEARPFVAQMAKDEGRITHWLSASVPWTAADHGAGER